MADIFISYKREDRVWAEALSRGLERQGWTTWWDTRLAAGESFDKVIERQLDAAKCVIVLWSKASVESKWVIAEAGEGLEREIIVPVFIEEARPPLVFRRIHTARLIGWKKSGEEAMFVRLIADVSRILGPSPKEQEAKKAREKEKRQVQERVKAEQAEQLRKQALEEARRKQEAEREDKRLAREQNERKEEGKPVTKPPTRFVQEPVRTGKQPGTEARPVMPNHQPLRRAALWAGGVLGLVLILYFVQQGFKPAPATLPADSGQSGDNEITRQGIEFVLIEEGSFQMGSDSGDSDEKPIHEVRISSPFYLGKYEITQAHWKAVMESTPSRFEGADRPVERVSWNDVQDFIRQLNDRENCDNCYRLPTEAEWEYAARAGTTTAYSFGDSDAELGNYAWYSVNSNGETHPVGQKQPNPWGLYDMHGNVWEWVADWYGPYSSGAQLTDPKGLNSGSNRVIRGGSWINDAGHLSARSAYR